MTPMSDIAAIADGLSEAQRKAVLFIGNGPYGHGISLFAKFWDRPENAGLLKVIRHELGLTATDEDGGGTGPVERLTPLGQQVREYLEGKSS